jgi:glycosyltransferase involved in cell wall biosynthesis
MTAREAMAYGRPVVVSHVGGLTDLNEGVEVVPPRDVDALHRALAGLLRDPKRAAQLGASGRAAATAAFSRQAEAERLVSLYDVSRGK